MSSLHRHGQRLLTKGVEWRADFREGLLNQETPTTWQRIATEIPMSTGTMEFPILHEISGMREWVGDRNVTKLSSSGYQITARKFERTIEIKMDDLEDDNLGLYGPRFRMLGNTTRLWPEQRVWLELLRNGFCYDGLPYFHDEHPEGKDRLASNQDMEGNGPTWYLFDTSKPLLPLIWGIRIRPQLAALDKLTDEVVFRRDAVQYGIRARGVPGYGFWQMAYRSNQPLTDANFNAAVTEMQKRKIGEPPDDAKDSNAETMNVTPTLLVCPSDLRADATTLVEMQIVAGGSGEAAGVSNRNFKALDVLVQPRIDPVEDGED